MGGAPLLLALAVVTVDAGWESDGRDGYRYIIQLPAEQLREIERTGQITSQLPEELRGRVSSVVIQVGNGDLPRPEVQPRDVAAEPGSAADPAETAAVGAASIYLPSPDETVRAQGDADRFSIPSMEELRQAGRQTAGEFASQAEAQLTETARQTAAQLASQAKSAIHSRIEGAADELQSRLAATDASPATSPTSAGPAANSYGTSRYRGFDETQSRAGNAPSTSGNSPSDAPSTSRPPAGGAAGNSPTGFAAADAQRDNRWSTGANSGSSSPSGTQAGASPTTSAQPGSLQPGQTQGSGTSSPATSGAGSSGSADPPPAATPWAFPQSSSNAHSGAGSSSPGSAQSGSASTPPSLANPQNAPNSANSGSSDSSAGNRYATPPPRASEPAYADTANSTQSRQAMDDRQLLEEVGIDASGHAYDKRTNQLLYEDDARYPLIVDYVRRMEQAEKNRVRGRDDATARGPAAAVPSRPIYADVSPSDYSTPAPRTNPPASGDAWGQWGYDARGGMTAGPNGYGSPPAYNPSQPFGGYPQPGSIPPGSGQPPANWQLDPRLAQTPPAATPPATAAPSPAAENSRPATESKQGSANESDERSRDSKSREPGITAQPLFNSMLLLSVIGNIYMGMQISRLIRRYRNLLSNQRGTAITA